MKPSIPSFGIHRRALLSTLAVLPALSDVALFRPSRTAQTEPPAPYTRISGEHFMDRRIAAAFCMAALGLGISSAHAGPCSTKIAQFELAVRQSAGKPNAGPFAPQSIGAQIDRQPTPASIKRAKERAQANSQRPWRAPSGLMHKAIELDVHGHSQPPRICTICNERLVRDA